MKDVCLKKDELLRFTSPYFDTMAQEILAQGKYLRCRVSGRSMYPFIKSGAIILVEPMTLARLKIGDIIFFRRPWGTYVAHRLIKKNGSGMLLTKGDSHYYYDALVNMEEVLGRVIQIEIDGKCMKLTGLLSRVLGWLLAWLARSCSPAQIRFRRNLARLWWLIGWRRMS